MIIPIRANIIQNKISLDIVPFTDCNLNCQFCETVKTRSKFDPTRFDKYYDYIHKIVNENDCKSLYFHLQGGELFMDKLTDEQVNFIENFVTRIENLCDDHSIECELCIISNLITRKIHRVVDFINRRKDKSIITSFDLDGRFTKQFQINLWYNNVDTLIQNGIEVSVNTIATKTAIQTIYDKKEPYYSHFMRIYDNYPCFVSEYNDFCHIEKYATTRPQYGEFVKYLFDNYPKLCYNYVSSLQNKKAKSNHMCNRVNIEFTNDWIHEVCLKCHNHDYGYKLMKARGCHSCNYFGICNMHCSDNLPIENYFVDRDVLSYIEQKLQ